MWSTSSSNLAPIFIGKQITHQILTNEKIMSADYFNSTVFLFLADASWNGALKWYFLLIFCSLLCIDSK